MPNLQITTLQAVELDLSMSAPVSALKPPTAPVTWSVDNPQYLLLESIGGNPNAILGIGVGVGTATVTATNGTLTTTFVIQVLSPAGTAFNITAQPPFLNSFIDRNRGRGLGLGYA